MHHVDDFYRVRENPVNEQVVGVNDCFAGAVDASLPIHERIVWQAFRAGFDSSRNLIAAETL